MRDGEVCPEFLIDVVGDLLIPRDIPADLKVGIPQHVIKLISMSCTTNAPAQQHLAALPWGLFA